MSYREKLKTFGKHLISLNVHELKIILFQNIVFMTVARVRSSYSEQVASEVTQHSPHPQLLPGSEQGHASSFRREIPPLSSNLPLVSGGCQASCAKAVFVQANGHQLSAQLAQV